MSLLLAIQHSGLQLCKSLPDVFVLHHLLLAVVPTLEVPEENQYCEGKGMMLLDLSVDEVRYVTLKYYSINKYIIIWMN